jgi:hypothetical protein
VAVNNEVLGRIGGQWILNVNGCASSSHWSGKPPYHSGRHAEDETAAPVATRSLGAAAWLCEQNSRELRWGKGKEGNWQFASATSG